MAHRWTFTALALALVGAGCTVDPAALAVADTFFQGANDRVDVVFVVDDSNSMEALQGALAGGVPTLLAGLDAAGVDYQIGVVTTDMDDPDRRGRLVNGALVTAATPNGAATLAASMQPGILGSQLERGLAAAHAALTPPLATHENEGIRREGTRVAAIIVSDEDDCSDDGALPAGDPGACASLPGSLVPLTDYASAFRALVDDPTDASIHALVETGAIGEFDGCGGLNVGTRYVQIARSLGGWVSPHCADMTGVMNELALQLAGRRTAFPLSRTPDPRSITVTLATDVQPIGDDDDSAGGPNDGVDPTEQLVGTQVREDVTRTDGWTYDLQSNTLRFWGPSLPGLGDAIQVRFTVGTSG